MLTVELLNNLDVHGPLHGWRTVQAVGRDMDVGTWQLQTPVNENNVGLLTTWLALDLPGFAVRDTDTGWRFSGFLTEYSITETATRATTRL